MSAKRGVLLPARVLIIGLIGLAGLAGLGGCKKEPAWKGHKFETRPMKNDVETELPEGLLRQIESVYYVYGLPDAEADGEKPKEDESSRIDGPKIDSLRTQAVLPSQFSPLKVYLIEKNRGILGQKNLELAYGPGGGELDLAHFVAPKNGSFYLAFEFMPALKEARRRVFYLSNSVKRQQGSEVLGSGCDTYFDVSGAFAKAMEGPGFLLNTTDGRHVSALAGTFFFAVAEDGKLYLARLTIRDSGQRSLQCRR